MEIMTDASGYGWCSFLLPNSVRGVWNKTVHYILMNWKELNAIILTIYIESSFKMT